VIVEVLIEALSGGLFNYSPRPIESEAVFPPLPRVEYERELVSGL
jgi:hypothetical protein